LTVSAGLPQGPAVPDWDPPASVVEQLAALDARLDVLEATVIPQRFQLLGPLGGAGYTFPAAQTTYSTPSDGFTANTARLHENVLGTVNSAYAKVVWTPGNASCGVRFSHAEDGPVNETTLHEFTGSASATPIASEQDITSALQALVDGIVRKNLVMKAKGSGAVGPILYAAWIEVLWGL
jgi:hypothetical protein